MTPGSEPTFSVVMPAYNASATVAAAIRSVLRQTRGDFELLVVDDGSTDGTSLRVRPFEEDPRVRLVRQENRGQAAARNAALARARGRFVSMLDSDDLWMPRYLEAMYEALHGDETADLAYTDAWVLDDRTRRIQRVTAMHYQRPPASPPKDPAAFFGLLLERNFIFVSATVRRSALEHVGNFNTSLRACEDYELWLRILARGHRAVRAQGVLALYRKRPGTLSSDELLTNRSLLEVLRIVADQYEVSAAFRDLARARIRRLETTLGPDRGSLALGHRIRLALIELKRVLLARWLWYRVPPPEVAAAFPDLGGV